MIGFSSFVFVCFSEIFFFFFLFCFWNGSYQIQVRGLGIEPLVAYFCRHEIGIYCLPCSYSWGSTHRPQRWDAVMRPWKCAPPETESQSRSKSVGLVPVCATWLQKLVLPGCPVRKQDTHTCVFVLSYCAIYFIPAEVCKWLLKAKALNPSPQ